MFEKKTQMSYDNYSYLKKESKKEKTCAHLCSMFFFKYFFGGKMNEKEKTKESGWDVELRQNDFFHSCKCHPD
jgi:hypothetical protein